MNILLAGLTVLPKLVEGKVAVITEGGYKLYKPSKNIKIEDYFNPMEYSILNVEGYPTVIVYSREEERIHYLVNKQLQEMRNRPIPYRIDDLIHIHSRQGMYRVVAFDEKMITITCKKWEQYNLPHHNVPVSDFKCLAGGRNNAVYE